MNTQRKTGGWGYGFLLALFCIMSLPHLVGAAPLAQIPTGPGTGYNGTPDYYTTANWANSPPLAKFVDKLPGLGSAKKNNIVQSGGVGTGQYLSVAKPDTITYPGTDYYEIELRQYNERMHSDLPLPGTLLRGYVQVNNGTDSGGANTLTPDPIHYLGPIIVAQRDRPVRLKFTNKLPIGTAGDLFIPVDTTVMGAGFGPAKGTGVRGVGIACDNTNLNVTQFGYPVSNAGCDSYTQNRADIHLHGGRTPWISDGTPHQWITPADEITPFAHGASLVNVPDMPDPGDGSATYYFTNQQSARLMFYHDHAFGITRLNVYAGEAAGYLITDPYEQDLVTRGIIPADQIPLIIQDKTFVDASEIRKYDPLWNWGSGPLVNGVRTPVEGDLWMPHVYMPAQSSIAGAGGVNPFGRWMYGPWFYPATVIEAGPKDNPYYDPDCSSPNPFVLANCQTPGQPTQIPGTPNVSMGMEAFQDSAVVNGTAFPSLTVDPRAYRFRILNAAGDRFQNLSFYVADDTAGNISPDPRLLAADKSNKTEVKTIPASAELARLAALAGTPWPEFWPTDGRDGGVPDPATQGPSFIQIGTEGGFLPQPVVINPQPITYVTDPTAFWVGNVDKMGLALGPAERADVIVDFTAFAGKTLILYNDAPAAWPARVAGYDYFTGAPDMRDSGGYGAGGVFNPATGIYEAVGADVPHGILPGYAPNTRTVMQVIVTGAVGTADPAPAFAFDQAKLVAEFTGPAAAPSPYTADGTTLFERAQEPIIVGQAAYKNTYPKSNFPTNFPWEGIAQINDQSLQFVTLKGDQVVAVTEPKGIHDEMGASFDPVYGRMSGNLAMQIPNPTTLTANLILYGFSDVPTETIKNSLSADVTVNAATKTLTDGTQIWKISHNGVDTHPIHFHIFDVQLINRVGWDGQILMPEPNELGWKDTVKISPLEDTIVAVRPRAPAMPFGIPNSIRPLNPAIPLDSPMGFNSIDPTTGQAYVAPSPYAGGVTNIMYDFGWEYVWHCHILSHEEMDMMRPIVLQYEAALHPAFTASLDANGVNWVDATRITTVPATPETYRNADKEIGFNVYRTTGGVFTVGGNGQVTPLNPVMIPANSNNYPDAGANSNGETYVVEAFTAKGSTLAFIGSPFTVTASYTNGPTFTSPGPVNLEAAIAGLPTGITISKVDFYNGATLIGTDTTAPYTLAWNAAPVGTNSITAKASINIPGGVVSSAALPVVVGGSLVASFTPADATSQNVCAPLTFTSTSTGTITGYSWLINGANYTTSSVTPVLHAGVYPVSLGVTNGTEVAQVTNTITITNNAPTVTSTGGPYTVGVGGTLNLLGTGSDADACDIPTLSYAWDVDGKNGYEFTTANPSISYNALKAVLGLGSHTITFKVTDSSGAFSTATTTLIVSAAPGTPTPVSPSGSNVNNIMPFVFTAVSGATGYQVSHYDYQTASATQSAVLTPAQAGCPTNTGNCSVLFDTPFAIGAHVWNVAAHSATGMSLWSSNTSFTVVSQLPATPSAISPSGAGIIDTSAPFVFTAVPGATGYKISHYNYQTASATQSAVLTPAQAGCPTNTGNCSVAFNGPFAAGNYAWNVQAQNAVGASIWSANTNFTVVINVPTAPTAVSPSGAGIIDTSAPFVFTAVPGATGYMISHYNYQTASATQSAVLTPAQAGCPTNTGNCSVAFNGPFAAGNYTWNVQALNTAGSSIWSPNTNFSVSINIPATPTVIGPSGANVSANAPFVFTAVPGATGYMISHYNYQTASATQSAVLTPVEAGCPTNTGNCSVAFNGPFAAGNYTWNVQALNTAGGSIWSPNTNFTTP